MKKRYTINIAHPYIVPSKLEKFKELYNGIFDIAKDHPDSYSYSVYDRVIHYYDERLADDYAMRILAEVVKSGDASAIRIESKDSNIKLTIQTKEEYGCDD